MSKKEQIVEIASKVKNTLTDSWYETKSFQDNDKMSGCGLMAESIGVTSSFLMAVAFNKEPNFWDDNDHDILNEMAKVSTKYIYDEYQEKGFTAEPEISAEETSDYFNKKTGYMDSATWVLSAMVLVRYAQRQDIIKLDKETQDIVFELISITTDMTLNAQHDDGTWGFLSDKECFPSTLFTYFSCNTIGDFFDYINGEIGMVDGNSDKDDELIRYLNDTLGYDVITKLNDARVLASKWAIKKCLPILPRLSSCKDLSDAEYKEIGAWYQAMPQFKDSYYDGLNFYNLYYTYYIIDMMTISGADLVFQDIVSTPEGIREIANTYKKSISDADFRYFFGNNDSSIENADPKKLYESLYLGYMEQAIHAAKNNFMIASRTGKKFWDSVNSELKIHWEHTDSEINYECESAMDHVQLTDPAILPMALRVNTCFSYYISQEKEYTLKRLYQMIIDSMVVDGKGKCRPYSWDDYSYNLHITERCIEAIVDYYDYVVRFEEKDEAPVAVQQTVTEKEVRVQSDLDKAIEARVNEILDKKLGTAEKPLEQAVSSGTLDTDAVIDIVDEKFNQILDLLSSTTDIYNNFGGDENADHILRRLLELHVQLEKHSILRSARLVSMDEYNSEKSVEAVTAVTDRINKLRKLFIDDADNATGDLVNIYNRAKR